MRLIDADALRRSLELERGNLRSYTPNSVEGIPEFGREARQVTRDIAAIDAAPTISCEACEFGRIGTFDQAIVHCALNKGEAVGRAWFCGDFQRRQP